MKATANDIGQLAQLLLQLWPDHTAEEAASIASDYVTGDESAAFVRVEDGRCVGLAMCGLRHDYVEGCETSPVGYLEGIIVDPACRGRGIAKALCGECEAWARERGCTEFASDCEAVNTASHDFHLSIGFTEENRIICFKKMI